MPIVYVPHKIKELLFFLRHNDEKSDNHDKELNALNDKIEKGNEQVVIRNVRSPKAHRQKNSGATCLCVIVLLMLLFVIFGGILLYRRYGSTWTTKRSAWCVAEVVDNDHLIKLRQKVTVSNASLETIEVPDWDQLRKAEIFHDFARNMTTIVDEANQNCFSFNLDRNKTRPPKDFIDFLNKFKTEYYKPNVKFIRTNYQVVARLQPEELKNKLGTTIYRKCGYFASYLLKPKRGKRVARSTTQKMVKYAWFNGYENIIEVDFVLA